MTSLAGSVGTLPRSVFSSSWSWLQISVAMCQRARKVAVSSQRVSSQPDTFGGSNSIWPAWSHSHDHAVVSIARPLARSMPAACTTGGLDIRRSGSYRCGWRRIATSSGRTLRPDARYIRSSARAVPRGGGVGMK